jgi:probable HAF family extracellular repeat protein
MPVYNFTTFDDPSAGTGGTQAAGINDLGQIVGGYAGADTSHGFLLSGGTYTTLTDPLTDNTSPFGTQARGINAGGQIVGAYDAGEDGIHGFIYNPAWRRHLQHPRRAGC